MRRVIFKHKHFLPVTMILLGGFLPFAGVVWSLKTSSISKKVVKAAVLDEEIIVSTIPADYHLQSHQLASKRPAQEFTAFAPPPIESNEIAEVVVKLPERKEVAQEPIVQTPVVKPPLQNNQEGFLINFNNVSMIEYIRFISKITGKNFVFEEADLQFNVTIISEEATSLDNIMAALLQELRIHGLSLIEQGNSVIIHTNLTINSPGTVLTDDMKSKADIVTRVFRLNTLDAERSAAIVKPLLSAKAIVDASTTTSHLIVTDFAANIAKIADLIASLDAPVGGHEIGQYVVKSTNPQSMIYLAEQILRPIAQDKPLTLVPHGATNSVFIISTPFLVDRAMAIMQQLDGGGKGTRIMSLKDLKFRKDGTPILPGEEEEKSKEQWTSDLPLGSVESTQFAIHKLQYRKGNQVSSALRSVGDSLQTTNSGSSDLISTINSVQWIESSNSLIFTGTQASLDKLKDLITEIDAPVRQVFLEMLIMDCSVDDSLNFGVEWGSRFKSPSAAGGQLFSGGGPLSNALDAAIATGSTTLDPTILTHGAGFGIGIIGRHITMGGLSFNSVGALVNAIHSDARHNIILNPKIVVEDNVAAEIFVGTNTRFQTQAIANNLGTIVTSNFEYRDLGARLKVTPYLGSNEIITLEIEQEVSSDASPPTAANTETGPTVTSKSNTRTRVHVPDNFFVILSGMIHDEDSRVRTQIPCLGGIPFLGAAFSQKNNSGTKRNILIFIRPHIIDTGEEHQNVTRRQQNIVREKNRSKNGWKYEVDEALDLFNLQKDDEARDNRR